MFSSDQIIKKFNLKPLPEEGGYYRETYRDPHSFSAKSQSGKERTRRFSTCIYYLITPDQFSGLHAVKSTEIFHFYAGDPVEMIQIDQKGNLNKILMGSDIEKNETPQVIIPPLVWQGTKLKEGGKWALFGCTVSPGFEFEDFLGGTFKDLAKKFPQHVDIIRTFTHDSNENSKDNETSKVY